MAIIKCKMCGGDLLLVEGKSVAECEFCGSVQTVPTADSEKKLTLFARANRLRAACEFDKAAGIYENIVSEFPEEAEAYWGLVLCKYGIEYVDDPATGKKIPTCHRSSFESILEDNDLEQALENADPVARKVYREEARQIEEIRKGIIAVSANEQPYDIFICYKETDPNGDRTLDSVLAQDVYDALTDKGYRVFFSRISLEDKLGVEYEPYIFAALNSAKIMLVFGTDYEYFNAVWVKNEWSRYLKLMAKDKDKHLIPCFKGIDAYDMPKEFARLQAQDLGKVGAVQDLLRGIEKILPRTAKETIIVPQFSATSLLRRAQMFLEDKNWAAAVEYCEKVLDMDPENGQAYLLQLMAIVGIKQFEELKDCKTPFYDNPVYQKVLRFADAATKATIKEYADQALAYVVQAQLDSAYKIGKKMMADAKTEDDFMKAAEQFDMISHYADCAALADECLKRAKYLHRQALASQDISKHYRIKDGIIEAYSGKDTEVLIPYGIIGINIYPFKWNNEVISVEMPDSLEFIGKNVFANCTKLTNLVFSNNIKTIEERAFEQCSALESITIPASIEKIDRWAFSNCLNLKSVTIGGHGTVIANGAFLNCERLRSVIFEEGVVSIGGSLFYGCSSLASVSIPSSMEHIGEGAFSNCENLREIIVDSGNPFYYVHERCLIDRRTKEVLYVFQGASIPADGSVTSIGPYALNYHNELTSIFIPDAITAIGKHAFYKCQKLQSVSIPNTVISIGNNAFESCEAMESINIPASVNHIGAAAFCWCNNLKTIHIDPDNSCFIMGNNCLIDLGEKTMITALFGGTIPDDGSVVCIGRGAFAGHNELQEISIPCGVERIDDNAFRKCENLQTVTIADSVKRINANVFLACKALTSINIPRSVEQLGQRCFRGCENLASITISDGVKTIDEYAFCNCNALTSITIPGSVERLEKSCFSDCKNLTSVTIAEGVKTINEHAFRNCNALTSITIPGSIDRLVEWSFSDCKNLESVTIAEGVKTIDKYAFYNCDNLASLCLPESVTTISSSGFPNECVIRSKPNSYAHEWAEINKLKWEEDEETRQIRLAKQKEWDRDFWRRIGRCQHCGGELKGLFSKKCVSCGKSKDY